MKKTEEILTGLGSKARLIKLSTEDKASYKKQFLQFMKLHVNDKPLCADFADPGRSVSGRWTGLFWRMSPTTTVFMLCFLLGTGLVFASNYALPGDSLYTLKVEVMERAQSFWSTSEERRASIYAEQALRRLEEAEALIEKGLLRHEESEALLEGFEQRSRDFLKDIELLKQKNKQEIAHKIEAEFHNSVNKRQHVLNKIKKD
jgi:hypothetical protein